MNNLRRSIFLVISYCIVIFAQDANSNLRLSEIELNVDKLKSYTHFEAIELWSPDATATPSGVTAVIFSGSTLKSIHSCSCDTAFSGSNYALCDCGVDPFQTIEFVGAIALYNSPLENFPDGTDVATVNQDQLLDVVLWQSDGTLLLPNPLQQAGYFAVGQSYHYMPPSSAQPYSIIRCYGDAIANGQWQASFSWNTQGTPGQPNNCSSPVVIVNEINFNKAFIELQTDPIELPLDDVTLASVDSTGTVIQASTLVSLRANSDSYFTVGRIPSDLLKLNWNLPMTGQTAIVAYYKATVVAGQPADTTFLSAIVYDPTETQPTSGALKAFGKTAYKADQSGTCSICVCPSGTQLAFPTLGQENDCTTPCPSSFL